MLTEIYESILVVLCFERVDIFSGGMVDSCQKSADILFCYFSQFLPGNFGNIASGDKLVDLGQCPRGKSAPATVIFSGESLNFGVTGQTPAGPGGKGEDFAVGLIGRSTGDGFSGKEIDHFCLQIGIAKFDL